jgi:hypothetical protein
MQQRISQLHQGLAWLFLAGLLLQLYLAGAPMFGVTSFQPHQTLGSALMVLAIVFPVLALVGRLGRQRIGLSILLVILIIVQGMLPSLRGTISWLAALHSINALVLMGVSARIGRSGRAAAAVNEARQTVAALIR